MPFIHRRVFYGKVGVADQLVQHLKDAEKAFQGLGAAFKIRILSDYGSGRTDRVVWEYEVADLREIDAYFDRMMADPQGQATFNAWFQKLTELIHYAEVETWTVC